MLNGAPEIFRSIYGEGPNAGEPCVFLRLSTCNLQCFWCDTDYTWNWKGTPFRHRDDNEPAYSKYAKVDHLIELHVKDVANMIHEVQPDDKELHIVITGGEPLLQARELKDLLELLKEIRCYHFEIETNGTIRPSESLDRLVQRYNVSPKLSNSAMGQNLRERATSLRFFASSQKSFFRFVVTIRRDIQEALDLVKRYHIPLSRVCFVPEGRTPEEIAEKSSWLTEECLAEGIRYSGRLHISLFGNTRGT